MVLKRIITASSLLMVAVAALGILSPDPVTDGHHAPQALVLYPDPGSIEGH